MKLDLTNLPTDIKVAHAIIVDLYGLVLELRKTIVDMQAKIDGLVEENKLLKQEIAILKKGKFGSKSEKVNKLVNKADSASTQAPDKQEPKSKSKRKPLPANLSRNNITIAPPAVCPGCGGEEFRKISEDISEELDYIPAKLIVNKYIRPRCACVACETIVQGDVPSKTIAKGKAGAGLLAHILLQKYCDHLPLYRQSQIFEREGIDISRSTMCSWVQKCHSLLTPLIDVLKNYVFSSNVLHGDDTPVKVLDPGSGKTKTGRIWAYVKDGRPCGDKSYPAVVYCYSPDRKGIRPEGHLKNFSGVLHADAYAGFDNLYGLDENLTAKIKEAACWAHTRRKFYEVTVSNSNAGIAEEAILRIGKLYEIESRIRGMSADERLLVRQEETKPLVTDFFKFLTTSRKLLSNKSTTAKAINYAINLQEALHSFLSDGHIEIDNNAAERAMRTVAIGRKNWLFAGSDSGGEAAASIYTLIETAKMNKINPHYYLQKLLSVIQDHNSQKLEELLPWNIKLGEVPAVPIDTTPIENVEIVRECTSTVT